MESISETVWDVLISGTGLQQSLLALALSRSGKKVLHVDKNCFYGGPEAAFSLQEAEEWVKAVKNGKVAESPIQNLSDHSSFSLFSNVSITSAPQPEQGYGSTSTTDSTKLASSRAYCLSLSPQLIYSRSALLPILVSSKIFRQLEFQAVGSWWVYNLSQVAPAEDPSSVVDPSPDPGRAYGAERQEPEERPPKRRRGELKKVPNGREDIFTDSTTDLRSKRSLMKFLRFVADYENQPDVWEPQASIPFPEFLARRFNFPTPLQIPLLALAMTPNDPVETTTGFALPRIARHLRSIGVFGPGFGAIIPKWGGEAEISQVACRAGAVGGGVYMLGNNVERVNRKIGYEANTTVRGGGEHCEGLIEVQLGSGDKIKTKWIVGTEYDLPAQNAMSGFAREFTSARSISIVSSSLPSLFPVIAEGAPPAAGAIVVFPPESLTARIEEVPAGGFPPVYVIVHSSSTGECPDGQCVLYASVSAESGYGYSLLDQAIESLLESFDSDPSPEILYNMKYTQISTSLSPDKMELDLQTSAFMSNSPENVLLFPTPSLDLVFDDTILECVKTFWRKITGKDENEDEDSGDFMVFEDREAFETDVNNDE
ncbi:MAG: Rab proteins geranylgeranyltransferase component A [Geoglossum simile]|nr:MAG: Rab proteins geranylgeranyltransferase component A [Geoglossum simile]